LLGRQPAPSSPFLHTQFTWLYFYLFFHQEQKGGGGGSFYKLHRLTFISKNVNAQWISWQVMFFYLNIGSLEVTKNRILIKGVGGIFNKNHGKERYWLPS
jgi:hypothetical protein